MADTWCLQCNLAKLCLLMALGCSDVSQGGTAQQAALCTDSTVLLCFACCWRCSVDKWQMLHLHPFRHYTIVKVTRSPMLATLSNHSSGISFWLDCYKSDWETTDWSTQWLFGWFRKLVSIEGDAGPQGKRQKAQSLYNDFFLQRFGNERTRNWE